MGFMFFMLMMSRRASVVGFCVGITQAFVCDVDISPPPCDEIDRSSVQAFIVMY